MQSISDEADRAKRSAFVEKLGLQVESTGWMPRMSGRVLGLLLVAEQPLTQAEMREELLASAGSISSASRELVSKRLGRRVSIPGSRQTALELHPDAWRSLEEDGLRGVQDYSALARSGVDEFAPDSAAARNLGRMRDYFAVVESRMRHVLSWLDETGQRP